MMIYQTWKVNKYFQIFEKTQRWLAVDIEKQRGRDGWKNTQIKECIGGETEIQTDRQMVR